jgi:hypothetical protein
MRQPGDDNFFFGYHNIIKSYCKMTGDMGHAGSIR